MQNQTHRIFFRSSIKHEDVRLAGEKLTSKISSVCVGEQVIGEQHQAGGTHTCHGVSRSLRSAPRADTATPNLRHLLQAKPSSPRRCSGGREPL